MPLLSDAKSCFVGTTPVNKIYAGSDLVWPKEVYPPNSNVLDYFACDNTYKSFPPFRSCDLIPAASTYWYPTFSSGGKLNQCLLFQDDGPQPASMNGLDIDKSSIGQEGLNLINFIEAYVKIDLVTESTTNREYCAQLTLSDGIPLRGSNESSLYLQPEPDGTMRVREVMVSSYENAPSAGYERFSYIPYAEPSWLHVSLSMVTKLKSSDQATLTCYFSVNGIVNKNTMGLNSFPKPLDKYRAGFKTRFSGSQSPGRGDFVLIDEVRTASEPLYTEDFNPA